MCLNSVSCPSPASSERPFVPAVKHRKIVGTSLVEILVVIVVFLVGILAVIQIYPGGFKILNNSRSLSIANAMAHDMGERLKGRGDQLPDAILPVSTPTTLAYGIPDANRSVDDMSVYDEANSQINGDGSLTYQGNTFPDYRLYAGPNVFRRVIGEGIKIPSPTSVGNFFGGVAILQFGPVRQSATDFFPVSVYSTDYQVNVGATPTGSFGPGQCYVDDPNSPAGNLSFFIEDDSAAGAPAPQFKASLVVYVQNGGLTQRLELTNVPVLVPSASGNQYRWYSIPLSSLIPAGSSYLSCDPNSLHLQRVFNQVLPNAFSQVDPYQVSLFNSPTGVLMFNPLSYNYTVTGSGGRRDTLRAKVDYEVLDWRVLHDDIRLGNGETTYRLSLPGIKVLSNVGPDGLLYHGLGVRIPDYNLNLRTTDVMFQDVATGGIFLYGPENPQDPTPPTSLASNDIWLDPTKSSFYVDKSAGNFKLVDANRSTLNGTGLQIMLALPDPTAAGGYATPIPVNAEGRTVRVYYMARNEWTAFPRTAVALYHNANLAASAGAYALSPGQYQPGTAGTRIYFPVSDVGNKVSIDQVYYQDAGNAVHLLENQSYIVKSDTDPHGPYIDIKEATSGAARLDYSHGYAVQGVHGASISTRVMYNPDAFHLGQAATNTNAFDVFNQSWRRVTVDTILQRGSN